MFFWVSCKDYTKEELIAIFKSFCAPYGMELNTETESCFMAYLDYLMAHKPENFANGREMRNLFETMFANQANRLLKKSGISDSELCVFMEEDLPAWLLECINTTTK